jgi:hypothetical protein
MASSIARPELQLDRRPVKIRANRRPIEGGA